jgi:NAD(P)-dependent dehydrogenase (short-subunit alcohol dehydrogenase family)
MYFCYRRYCGGPICYCKARLDNQIVIVTGGTSGIGLAITKHFAKLGAIVIFTARDIEKGIVIQENIRSITSNQRIYCKFVDFVDLGTVHKFVTEVKQICPNIYLLVNNIGVFFHPPQETVDGFDVTFQSNYLSNT